MPFTAQRGSIQPVIRPEEIFHISAGSVPDGSSTAAVGFGAGTRQPRPLTGDLVTTSVSMPKNVMNQTGFSSKSGSKEVLPTK